MIAHVSIPSPTPRETAKILGEFLGGQVMQFAPLGPEGYVVYSATHGDQGVLVEVLNDKLRHIPGERDDEPVGYGHIVSGGEKDVHSIVHVAMTTPLSPAEIKVIADRVGWRCVECWRGNAFPQSELWVDNRFMFELMSPDQCDAYVAAMAPTGWTENFGMKLSADGVYDPDPEISSAMEEIRFAMSQGRKLDLVLD
jgi:hypothetical protein